jgi:hypothetical protein
MPWLETSPVEQRERFIRDHQAGLYMMTELCARYAVRASPTLRKTPLGLSILLGLTISILNRVARRTKQSSQANAAAPSSPGAACRTRRRETPHRRRVRGAGEERPEPLHRWGLDDLLLP